MSGVWRLGKRLTLTLDCPRIMAILNVTPDSFADGGRYGSVAAAVEAALGFVEEGADVIDVGGESTRPGAAGVGAEEQLRRVIPVIRGIRENAEARRGAAGQPGTPGITIDTTSALVAREALDAGADAVNDVSGATADAAMLPLVAERGAGIILMHRVRTSAADSYSDAYAANSPPPMGGDAVGSVRDFLASRAAAALSAGVHPESIMIDPGLGFGKTVIQNLELIRGTPTLAALGYPVLSALSRKSFTGRISLGRDSGPDERLAGTLALSVVHLHLGARLFRVHDVKAHYEALAAAWAVLALPNAGREADV